MSIILPSARSEFAGFPEFHAAEIAPYLREKEHARRKAVTHFALLAGAGAAISGAIVLFAPFGAANTQFAVIAGFAALAGATFLLNRTRDDIAHGLLERIAGRLGFAYRGKLQRPAYYEDFKALKMLPSHNREDWEDEVVGAHAGAPFTLCEAHLKFKSSGKNSSTRTVFHGQLILVDYPKRFLGVTVIRRDAGVMNALMKPGRDFSRVQLVSADFERAFEAWTTDQVEARDLLDPVVLERFQELERLFGGKKLRAAFTGGKLLIAIETGDRMTLGTMFASLEDKGRVERALKEFDVVFDLIDVLLKRAAGRLDMPFSLGDVR